MCATVACSAGPRQRALKVSQCAGLASISFRANRVLLRLRPAAALIEPSLCTLCWSSNHWSCALCVILRVRAHTPKRPSTTRLARCLCHAYREPDSVEACVGLLLTGGLFCDRRRLQRAASVVNCPNPALKRGRRFGVSTTLKPGVFGPVSPLLLKVDFCFFSRKRTAGSD